MSSKQQVLNRVNSAITKLNMESGSNLPTYTIDDFKTKKELEAIFLNLTRAILRKLSLTKEQAETPDYLGNVLENTDPNGEV